MGIPDFTPVGNRDHPIYEMLPVELSVNSLRMMEQSNLSNTEYNQAMLQELEDLEEDRLDAYNLLVAQKKIAERAYKTKNVRWRRVSLANCATCRN